MTVDQLVASAIVVIQDLGDKIFQVIFGLFPTWFTYAVPLAVFVLIVTYLFTRKSGRHGR